MVPALVLPIVITFLPLTGFRGFDASEESKGKNRPGFSASLNTAPGTAESNHAFASGEEGNDINGFKIRGRTTLQEIEEGTGIKAEQIIAVLNLPADLSKNERVSLIMGKYGFEMDRLRETVKNLAVKK